MSEIHVDYLYCLLRNKKYDEAYDYIIEHDTICRINLSRCILRIGHYFCQQKDDCQQGIKWYSLIKNKDSIPIEDMETIVFYYKMQHDYQHGLVWFRKCHEKNPGKLQFVLNIIKAYEQIEDTKNVERFYNIALNMMSVTHRTHTMYQQFLVKMKSEYYHSGRGPQFHTDLVNGYYRSNNTQCLAEIYISELTISYLWILESFCSHMHGNHYLISGIGSVCTRTSRFNVQPVFGENIVSSSNVSSDNYYHWRFKVLSDKTMATPKTCMIGVVKNRMMRWDPYYIKNNEDVFLFYNDATTSHSSDKYGFKWNKPNCIIDMFLDLNEGQLCYTVNDQHCGVAFEHMDTTCAYKMAVVLAMGQAIELMSYHHSQYYEPSDVDEDVVDLTNFIRSIGKSYFEDDSDKIKITGKKNVDDMESVIQIIVRNQQINNVEETKKYLDIAFSIDDANYNSIVRRLYGEFLCQPQNDYKSALLWFKKCQNEHNDQFDQKYIISIEELYQNTLSDTQNLEDCYINVNKQNTVYPIENNTVFMNAIPACLVNGYYRLNNGKYLTMDIHILSISYLWIFEGFDPCILSHNYTITGANNCVVSKKPIANEYSYILGQTVISTSSIENNYYHWRFKILNESYHMTHIDTYIVGIVEDKPHAQKLSSDDVLKDKNSCLFFGSLNKKSIAGGEIWTLPEYGVKWHKHNDILDMYLDLNQGELSFVINNKGCGVAFKDIDTKTSYRMMMKLYSGDSVELISYHHAKFYDKNSSGYSQTLSNVDEKLKYLETAMKLYPCMISLCNDYIDCLLQQQLYHE
eukprot:36303_1